MSLAISFKITYLEINFVFNVNIRPIVKSNVTTIIGVPNPQHKRHKRRKNENKIK
jgi:hypothetical protein